MGNYSQYHEYLENKNKEERREQAALKQEARAEKPATTERKKKRTYKEQQEYEQLAKDIEALENEKKELTAKLEQQLDYKEIEIIGNRIGEITDLIDEKELRWLELDEI